MKSPTRMIYGGARYYDPREARWMSRDPALEGNMAGGGVGDPRNLLSYGYAFNSPISYSDPDGRQSVPRPARTSQAPTEGHWVKAPDGRAIWVQDRVTTILGSPGLTLAATAPSPSRMLVGSGAVAAGSAVGGVVLPVVVGAAVGAVASDVADALTPLNSGGPAPSVAGDISGVGDATLATTSETTVAVGTAGAAGTAPGAVGGGGAGGGGSPTPIIRQMIATGLVLTYGAQVILRPSQPSGVSNPPTPGSFMGPSGLRVTTVFTPPVYQMQPAAPGSTLYHYTTQVGLNAILETQQILPSTRLRNPTDARYGDGQYMTDIPPNTRRPAQLSAAFIRSPFQGRRFTHYLAVDVSGMMLLRGRPNVYLIPNQDPLVIMGRVLSSGINVPPVPPI